MTIDWQASDDSSQASDPPDTVADQDGKDVALHEQPELRPVEQLRNRNRQRVARPGPAGGDVPRGAGLRGHANSVAFVAAVESDTLSGSRGETPGVGVDISSAGQKTVDITGEDFAGNTTTVTCPYTVVDSTSPTVVGMPDRQPNVFGWYRAPVTIDWQASDDSSQASDPPDTVADQDGKDVPYTSNPSCDPSNNCATGTVSVSLDQVPPVVTCREAPVFEVTQNSVAFVSADESDTLSGSGGETPGVGVDISSAGQKTVDITGEDFAGNTTTVTCPYTVVDTSVRHPTACRDRARGHGRRRDEPGRRQGQLLGLGHGRRRLLADARLHRRLRAACSRSGRRRSPARRPTPPATRAARASRSTSAAPASRSPA